MLTQNELVKLTEWYKHNEKFLAHNQKIFDIAEGELMTYIKETVFKQLNPKSAAVAMERAIPVNILNKLVEKLSGLYEEAPTRTTESTSDQELIDWYVREKSVDTMFLEANLNFNRYKNTVLEIYECDDELDIKTLPSNNYLPFTFNENDHMKVEGILKVLPYKKGGITEKKLWIYTDEQFISIDLNGNLIMDDMKDNEGENHFGVLNFSYASKSRYLLVPKPDSDTLQLTLTIPILFTDLAFSSMFLSIPILYTIDADAENLPIAPNMFWDIKSTDIEKKAGVGVIKPEPNIEAQLNMIGQILAVWLQSKNIKPGAITPQMTVNNLASGVAMVIEESDTTKDVKKQEKYFKKLEQDFWYRLAIMHNKMVDDGKMLGIGKFSDPEKLKIEIKYNIPGPIESKTEKANRLKTEKDAGLTSQKAAIKEYHETDDEGAEKMIDEIQSEKQVNISLFPQLGDKDGRDNEEIQGKQKGT